MGNEEKTWYGWKEIEANRILLGETIEKGDGIWKKEYTYIYIPDGYGYDDYCFLLSEKCVNMFTTDKNSFYFSLADDMKIELVYRPDKKEPGKRYKRYKVTGYELFETVFQDYEEKYVEESILRAKKELIKKEKREKKTIGTIVCGIYMGNNYGDSFNGYIPDKVCHVYFQGEGGTFRNKKFSKVHNVKIKFVIIDDVSLYFFNQIEEILNQFVLNYNFLQKEIDIISKWQNDSKIHPVVRMNSTQIIQKHYDNCVETIESIKQTIIKYTQDKFIEQESNSTYNRYEV